MVEIKDLGIGRLKAEIARMSELRVHAGVQGPAGEAIHPDADVSVAQVAAWLEFGTEDTPAPYPQPARPWLRGALDGNAKQIHERLRSSVSDLIDGRVQTAEEAMRQVADETKARVLKHFDNAREWAEPLAERTIAAKGHDQPLIGATVTVREAIDATVIEVEGAMLEAAE